MDGKYQNNKEEIQKSLQSWLVSVESRKNTWQGNDIHIDEIATFNNIKRYDWIHASFFVFNILLKELGLKTPLLTFLHINLSDTKIKSELNTLALNWLKNNVHAFTPPSFNCTTLGYYKNFYQKELIKCKVDNSLFKLIDSTIQVDFFYRDYFDRVEGMYLRELYIFSNYSHTPPIEA